MNIKVVENVQRYGYKIREIRERNNETREELAKKLGISESALGKYERGERSIKPELMERIAEVYEVPFANLFGRTVEIPEELKKAGVEWIAFIEDMEEQNLKPEEIRATLNLLKKLNITK